MTSSSSSSPIYLVPIITVVLVSLVFIVGMSISGTTVTTTTTANTVSSKQQQNHLRQNPSISRSSSKLSNKINQNNTNKYSQFYNKRTLKNAINTFLYGNEYEYENLVEYYGPIRQWDVSHIRDFSNLLDNDDDRDNGIIASRADNRNQRLQQQQENPVRFNDCDLSEWDVSSALNTSYMFYDAVPGFNQCIDNTDWNRWDVSNVISFHHMFYDPLFDFDDSSISTSSGSSTDTLILRDLLIKINNRMNQSNSGTEERPIFNNDTVVSDDFDNDDERFDYNDIGGISTDDDYSIILDDDDDDGDNNNNSVGSIFGVADDRVVVLEDDYDDDLENVVATTDIGGVMADDMVVTNDDDDLNDIDT